MIPLSRHVYSAHVLLVSRTLWEGLDAPTQAGVRRAALESRDLERKVSRESADRALAELRDKGMQVSSIPRADAERIRNRLRAAGGR